uniref:Uncharacterized protein n=1 Tax=Echeneis naucrates TaxID=173247 RepID=A0A665U1S1_ECHNA
SHSLIKEVLTKVHTHTHIQREGERESTPRGKEDGADRCTSRTREITTLKSRRRGHDVTSI